MQYTLSVFHNFRDDKIKMRKAVEAYANCSIYKRVTIMLLYLHIGERITTVENLSRDF
jgi:hypothetical protein